jgi:cell filamentation protein, protein adenylyltransferase
VSWDPYLDLRTGVLRNRLGITDPAEFARVEADFTSARIAQLWRHPLPGHYDLAHLQRFHQVIFGDLFEWAGELRTVTLGKGGALFCHPHELVPTAARVFSRLADDRHLRGLNRTAFVDKLATLLASINYLHPFREGSGRAQRAFLAQLSRGAGHVLRWARMDPEANRVASQTARAGDTRLLRAMLEQLVDSDPDRPPRPRTPSDQPE